MHLFRKMLMCQLSCPSRIFLTASIVFLLGLFPISHCKHFHMSQKNKGDICKSFLSVTIQIEGISEILRAISEETSSVIMNSKTDFDNNFETDVSGSETVEKDFCFFQGRIESTGEMFISKYADNIFSGTFSHSNQVYEIETYAPTSSHLLAHKKPKPKRVTKCGVKTSGTSATKSTFNDNSKTATEGDEHSRAKRAVQLNTHWNGSSTEKRYVQLLLVGDKAFTTKSGGLFGATFRIIEIANYVNALYRPLGLSVVLVHAVLWSTDDPYIVSSKVSEMLSQFMKYRMEFLSAIEHDAAHLVSGITTEAPEVGLAYYGKLCRFKEGGGVNSDQTNSALDISVTVAHELGHNLGFEHDDGPQCHCPDSRCIMAAVGDSINPLKWSNCSVAEYNKYKVFHGPGFCTTNYPEKSYGVYCGNGIVDDGEECDCGPQTFCTSSCCNPSTCKFVAGATCASGSCCNQTSCSVYNAGQICRPSKGECDLTEYCNGTSEWCPPIDDTKMDGTPCASGAAYCLSGSCNTRDNMCSNLFNAFNPSLSRTKCEQLTTVGDRSGYCDYTMTDFKFENYTYTACSESNLRCGTLYCRNNDGNPTPKWWFPDADTTNFQYADGGSIFCLSAQIDTRTTKQRDPGLVPNGAECGAGMMCVNSQCRNVSLYASSCPDCNGNGTCTKTGLCFCNFGWAPPFCNETGCGGSTANKPECVDGVIVGPTEATSTTTTQAPTTTVTSTQTTPSEDDFLTLEVTFHLNGSYTVFVTPNKNEFMESIKAQIALYLGMLIQQITKFDVFPAGTIRVSFTLVANRTTRTAPGKLVLTLGDAILTGRFKLQALDNTTLMVVTDTFKYNKPTETTPAPDMFWTYVGIAIGCGAAFLIIVAIIIIVVYWKKCRGKPSKGRQHVSTISGNSNSAYEYTYDAGFYDSRPPAANKYIYTQEQSATYNHVHPGINVHGTYMPKYEHA